MRNRVTNPHSSSELLNDSHNDGQKPTVVNKQRRLVTMFFGIVLGGIIFTAFMIRMESGLGVTIPPPVITGSVLFIGK